MAQARHTHRHKSGVQATHGAHKRVAHDRSHDHHTPHHAHHPSAHHVISAHKHGKRVTG